MKRVFILMMAIVMLSGTTAFAKEKKDVDKLKLK